MPRVGWWLGILAALVGLAPMVEPLMARLLYCALCRTADAPRGADLIAVFSGGGTSRVEAALDLVEQGYAPRVLFIGNRQELAMARSLAAARKRWAPGRICYAEREARNTADTVAYLHEWLAQMRPRSVLIASDGFHLPRIGALLCPHRTAEVQTWLVACGRGLDLERPAERMVVWRETVALAVARAVGWLSTARPA